MGGTRAACRERNGGDRNRVMPYAPVRPSGGDRGRRARPRERDRPPADRIPGEVLHPGDTVRVRVVAIDPSGDDCHCLFVKPQENVVYETRSE